MKDREFQFKSCRINGINKRIPFGAMKIQKHCKLLLLLLLLFNCILVYDDYYFVVLVSSILSGIVCCCCCAFCQIAGLPDLDCQIARIAWIASLHFGQFFPGFLAFLVSSFPCAQLSRAFQLSGFPAFLVFQLSRLSSHNYNT